jgi:hypothetical protein
MMRPRIGVLKLTVASKGDGEVAAGFESMK